MSEMIERVANAAADFDGRPLDKLGRADKDRYLARARVEIEAMREPSKDMGLAGFLVNKFENKQSNGEFGCPGVKCDVDPPKDWLDPENAGAVKAFLDAPKCLIARVNLAPDRVWRAMIDAALSEERK